MTSLIKNPKTKTKNFLSLPNPLRVWTAL